MFSAIKQFFRRILYLFPTLSPLQERIALISSYALLILGTLYWSGTVRDRNLYDIYTTRFEGVSIAVSDIVRANQFYQSVLNFSQWDKDSIKGVISFRLPDNKKLFVVEQSKNAVEDIIQRAAPSMASTVIRVKEKIDLLHQAYVKRLRKEPVKVNLEASFYLTTAYLAPGNISELLSHEWGQEFLITDPDGNRFIFVQGRPLRPDPFR